MKKDSNIIRILLKETNDGDPIVSVIVPVYKAEQFLDECLDSVIKQDYPALEIILVDDGSPDSCPERCDRYAEAYDYIKTIHQSNQGPGLARNAGLEVATGKYIVFVDSDDCLDGAGTIREMVEQAEKRRADIVVGSYCRSDGQRLSRVEYHWFQDGMDTETADFRFKGFVLYNLTSPWGKLYRHAFLTDNDLKFYNYPFGEDKSFNMLCCICKPVYAFIEESVYLYRANSDSVTSQYHDDYISVWTAIAVDVERFLSERGMMEEYGDLVAFHACIGLVVLAKQELMYGRGMSEIAKALSSYGENPLVRKMIKRLVCGRYIDQIELRAWRAMMWGASLLCSLHAYVPLAFGMWALESERLRKLLSKLAEFGYE